MIGSLCKLTVRMQVPCIKMHGAGNQILLVDQREKNLPPPGSEKLRKLGNEKTGPGFDQMLWLSPTNEALSVACYRIFNAAGSVTVSMSVPKFAADRNSIRVGDKDLAVSIVALGNPHCVILVDDVGIAPVNDLGPQIEHHERFPERTNVGFMQVIDRQKIALRVHERGAGETAACGTGACAAVVSGQHLGLLDEAVCVHLPGGQVMVS